MATVVPEHPTSADPLSTLYPAFLEALLAGDRRHCEALTDQALAARVTIIDLYQHFFRRALYRVGEEWEHHRIPVGVEHLATAIVEGLLNRLYPQIIAPRRSGRRIIIGSVEGELHQVGAKMACDVFEMHGWEALYLGADTPTNELLRTLQALTPDAVGLSLSVTDHLGALLTAIAAIRTGFPGLPLLIGGQGLRHAETALPLDPQIHYLADLNALDRFITDLQCEQPPIGA